MKKIITLFLAIAFAGCSGDGDSGGNFADTELTTMSAANLTPFTANITASSSRDIGNYSYGFMVGQNQNPSQNDGTSQWFSGNQVSETSFSAQIDYMLEPNTTYYVRAVISNGETIVYGNQVQFTTPKIVNTGIVRNISAKRFQVMIDVMPSGSQTVEDRGVVYSASPNPTIENEDISAGTGGTGEVEVAPYVGFHTVTPNTNYYLKAYVRVNGEYFYGNQVTFRTAGYLGGSGSFVFFDKGETTNGWRYLEVSPNEVANNNVIWGCTGFINGLSNDLGAGMNNTSLITSACSASNGAAKLCENAVINNQGDWFLPSKDEIDYLYDLKVAGIFTISSTLWTSSQFSTTEAFSLGFSNGSYYMQAKNQYTGAKAWPIRRF